MDVHPEITPPSNFHQLRDTTSPVVEFPQLRPDPESASGSESLGALPEWLRVERIEGPVPIPGDPREADWLRGLGLDTDRGIPAILQRLIEISGKKAGRFGSLAASPVVVATVDHLMGVAAPVRSAFLPSAIRVLTSDLILDEIDQYGPEDLAALARLPDIEAAKTYLNGLGYDDAATCGVCM